MFFWNSRFFYDPLDVGNLISGSSAFSKSSLNTWKFSVHVLLKPGLENFEHYFARFILDTDITSPFEIIIYLFFKAEKNC